MNLSLIISDKLAEIAVVYMSAEGRFLWGICNTILLLNILHLVLLLQKDGSSSTESEEEQDELMQYCKLILTTDLLKHILI